ncbi:MAG: hypothetical protein H6Q04_778 [Acidobacteria bacterium]|jgi:hypothetical protein|nr:hypothetical protein [Acidobacteriota bacterium]
MNCAGCEEKLSEYLEQALPEPEGRDIDRHLEDCAKCSALLEEMKSMLAVSRNFPDEELDDRLLEKILLRTSGQPRKRHFWEELRHFSPGTLLTPRFASGAVLATLFLVLLANLVFPRTSTMAAVLSPQQIFRQLDIGVQQIYGKGLQAYDATVEWQANLNFYKDRILNRLGFMMERLDLPVEGKAKSEEQMQPQQQKAPNNHSSMLLKHA